MHRSDFDSSTNVQADVQADVQAEEPGRRLNDGEIAVLSAPPDSHRLTLDGHCALAGARGQVVLYDVEGTGLRHVDLADLDPRGWTP